MGTKEERVLNSRRRFMSGAAVLGGAFVGAGSVSAKTPAKSIEWDETVDVIVVGSGVTGSCAAIAAAEGGSATLMIEKLSRLGGTTRYSGLDFACVGNSLQRAKGIEDRPEWLAEDMAKVSGGMGNPALALEMARTTARAERFLSEHGVKWDGRLMKLGGHSVARVIAPQGGGGGLLTALHSHMASVKNLQVRTRVKLDEIVLDESGRVAGVRVREQYFFDKNANHDDLENKSGVVRLIRARQGVVFASGGFARDRAYRAAEVPFLVGASASASPGATAGALKALIKAGAHPVHTSLFRLAFPLPTEDWVWGAMIDPQTVKRFASEGLSRNTLGATVLSLRLKNGDRKPFMVYDDACLKKFHNFERMERALNALNGPDGSIFKFKDLAAMADYFKVDAKALRRTLESYNAMISGGEDKEFKKPMERSGKKVEPLALDGVMYAALVSPRDHYTPGGVRINVKAQALSINDGAPIAGLYVAGEAAGGMHGLERLTACSMPDCASFGLIAGENVSREPRV